MAVRLIGEVDNSCECISVSALDLLGLDQSVDFPSFPVLFATGAGVSGWNGTILWEFCSTEVLCDFCQPWKGAFAQVLLCWMNSAIELATGGVVFQRVVGKSIERLGLQVLLYLAGWSGRLLSITAVHSGLGFFLPVPQPLLCQEFSELLATDPLIDRTKGEWIQTDREYLD